MKKIKKIKKNREVKVQYCNIGYLPVGSMLLQATGTAVPRYRYSSIAIRVPARVHVHGRVACYSMPYQFKTKKRRWSLASEWVSLEKYFRFCYQRKQIWNNNDGFILLLPHFSDQRLLRLVVLSGPWCHPVVIAYPDPRCQLAKKRNEK